MINKKQIHLKEVLKLWQQHFVIMKSLKGTTTMMLGSGCFYRFEMEFSLGNNILYSFKQAGDSWEMI